MEIKRCSKCYRRMSLDNFYFIKTKNKYRSHCLDCANEYSKFHTDQYKICTKKRRVCNGMMCRGEKEFNSKNGERYCSKCKDSMAKMEDFQ